MLLLFYFNIRKTTLKDGCPAWISAVWISLYLSSTFGFLTKGLPLASAIFLKAEPKTQDSVLGVHLRSHLGGNGSEKVKQGRKGTQCKDDFD